MAGRPGGDRPARARHWEVLLAGAAGRIRVELAETTTAPLFSNCAATVPLAIPTFAVQSIESLD